MIICTSTRTSPNLCVCAFVQRSNFSNTIIIIKNSIFINNEVLVVVKLKKNLKHSLFALHTQRSRLIVMREHYAREQIRRCHGNFCSFAILTPFLSLA